MPVPQSVLHDTANLVAELFGATALDGSAGHCMQPSGTSSEAAAEAAETVSVTVAGETRAAWREVKRNWARIRAGGDLVGYSDVTAASYALGTTLIHVCFLRAVLHSELCARGRDTGTIRLRLMLDARHTVACAGCL